MPYEWSLNVTLEIVKAFGPVIIGAAVAVVAFRQWRTAKDKLALDLFDRRLEAWQEIQAALDARHQEIRAVHATGHQALGKSSHLTALWGSLAKAHFLFGDDARQAFRDVEEAMYSFGATHPHDDDEDSQAGFHIKMTHHAIERVVRERANLEKVVEPYMMLDRIGVARPALKPRLPRKKAKEAKA